MAKRFTDTTKYKKPFIRGLQGAYKVLWDYLYHDCDHAGIWIKDFEIAQIYIGSDLPVNETDALKYFNSDKKRIIQIDNNTKWFLPDFIEFQYGELKEVNRAHASVIAILKKHKLYGKGLTRSLQGRKDKDKDKDKDKYTEEFETFWDKYPNKTGKGKAFDSWKKLKPSINLVISSLNWQIKSKEWLKDDGQYIPHPTTYLNQKRWEDSPKNDDPKIWSVPKSYWDKQLND